MHTFNDTLGRTWTVTINVDAIRRVRSLLDVNLLDAIEGKLLEAERAEWRLERDELIAACGDVDARIEAVRGEMDAERAGWAKERDELIAERDRFEAEAERHSKERRLAQDEMVRLIAEAAALKGGVDRANEAVATWRGRADWLLTELQMRGAV